MIRLVFFVALHGVMWLMILVWVVHPAIEEHVSPGIRRALAYLGFLLLACASSALVGWAAAPLLER